MAQTLHYAYLEYTPLRVSNEALRRPDLALSDANTFFENELFSTVTPLFYRERLRITFELGDLFKARMALIRGIIEFNRSSRFTFTYNVEKKTIESDILPTDVEALKSFLKYIHQLIDKEAQFKNALKSVMAFENEHKKLSASVYAGLYTAAIVD